MKLSSEERDVIASFTLQDDVPAREVAQNLRMQEHRVRRIIHKTVSNGACYFYPILNPHRLGYLECNLFIELQSGGAQSRQKLLQGLRDTKAAKTIGVLGGEYQFDVVVWLKGTQDLSVFVDTLSERCPDVNYRLDFVLLGKAYYLPANSLEPKKRSTRVISYGPSDRPPFELDSIDKEIIRGLYQSTFTGVRQLAQSRGIPTSTVTYRLNKLREQGVVVCMGYMIDHLKVGLTLTTLLIKAKRPCLKLTDQLLAFATQDGSYGFLVECFGAWDYQLGVLLYDQTRLSGVLDRLQENFGHQLDRICPVPCFENISSQLER